MSRSGGALIERAVPEGIASRSDAVRAAARELSHCL